MRLTCKTAIGYCDMQIATRENKLEKLGQYEDIEELCEKVVEKPIYEKFRDTGEIHKEDYTDCNALYNFKEKRIEFYYYDFVNYLEMKDYGIWWALTKEELEKNESNNDEY